MLRPYNRGIKLEPSETQEPLYRGHRSIRLKHCDYSAPGLYFVTVCAKEGRTLFGRVMGSEVELNGIGRLARECWLAIPRHFAAAALREFVIMPSHLHGTVELVRVGAQHAAPQTASSNACRQHIKANSLGAIVRSFKAAVTERARTKLMWTEAVWQRNYFERILRDGKEYADAARYIAENPLRWSLDKENPEPRS